MAETDQGLVQRARAGDGAAFRTLVERWSGRVFRLAVRMTGKPEDAEDIVQETFLKAYRQLGQYEFRSSFGTWIYRIASNCSVDLLRARERHGWDELPELAAEDPAPDRIALSHQFRQRLEAALRRLTPQERAAFLLRHYEGQSIEEIGIALDLSETAAKNSIFRAVQKLRRALEPLALCVTSRKMN